MRLTLEAMAGLLVGRKFEVLPGRPFVFGRSEGATVCLPHDPDLAPLHLEIVCGSDGARIRSLAPDSPLYVDGKRVSETVLRPGARIVAGRSTLVASMAEEPAAPPPPAAERTGPELLAWLGIEERIRRMAAPGETGRELVSTLVDENELPAAVRVMAFALGPRKSVWWGLVLAGEVYGGPAPGIEAETCGAARAWVEDPTEPRRRRAGLAAEAAGHRGIGAWLALAASWTGAGSAPVAEDVDGPDERLPIRAITAALRLAGARERGRENLRYRRFLDVAAEIDAGRLPLPAPPAPRRSPAGS